ncbi:hypothetical protein Hanom_Chr02g00149591 [Helianthus anomalus]
MNSRSSVNKLTPLFRAGDEVCDERSSKSSRRGCIWCSTVMGRRYSMVLVGLSILSEKNGSRTDTGLGFSLN